MSIESYLCQVYVFSYFQIRHVSIGLHRQTLYSNTPIHLSPKIGHISHCSSSERLVTTCDQVVNDV